MAASTSKMASICRPAAITQELGAGERAELPAELVEGRRAAFAQASMRGLLLEARRQRADDQADRQHHDKRRAHIACRSTANVR